MMDLEYEYKKSLEEERRRKSTTLLIYILLISAVLALVALVGVFVPTKKDRIKYTKASDSSATQPNSQSESTPQEFGASETIITAVESKTVIDGVITFLPQQGDLELSDISRWIKITMTYLRSELPDGIAVDSMLGFSVTEQTIIVNEFSISSLEMEFLVTLRKAANVRWDAFMDWHTFLKTELQDPDYVKLLHSEMSVFGTVEQVRVVTK